jgi:heterodisulfide reductase subunit A
VKIVLFLCRCGPNLAETIRLDEIAAWARSEEEVADVFIHDLYCSPAGREEFVARVCGSGADRVVFAGCTPKMHEVTFGDLAEEAGLNRAAVAIANLREHCAWTTRDPEVGTAKARALIRGAVRRVAMSEPLEGRSMEVLTDLLVIGGGLAGVEAALTAANAGRKVTLVEREIALGGGIAKSEDVSPNGECAPCLIAPRTAAVRDHENIDLVTSAEVFELRGFFGNFVARIRREARYVKDDCIGCAACFDACPEEEPDRFFMSKGTRKAIHVAYPGSVPAAAAIDADRCRTLLGEKCDACVPLCPFGSIDFEDRDEEIERTFGGVIVATGLVAADVTGLPELGHGRLANVMTIDELSVLTASNGPTGGRVERSDGTAPASAVFVHRAGSSSAMALTAGRLLAKQGVSITHLHGDLALPGPGAQALLREVREGGAEFRRVDDDRTVRVAAQGGRLTVVADGLDTVTADLVVLATGRAPANRDLSEVLGLSLSSDGWFVPGHAVLGETATATDGIWLAGSVAAPCDAATAVTRARRSPSWSRAAGSTWRRKRRRSTRRPAQTAGSASARAPTARSRRTKRARSAGSTRRSAGAAAPARPDVRAARPGPSRSPTRRCSPRSPGCSMNDRTTKIVGFLCNWCSYAGADHAGGLRVESPGNLRLIRVMCTGRIDPQYVMAAFRNGADGVLLLGCHHGDCHYRDGNRKAERRAMVLRALLPGVGIDAHRLVIDWVGAAEGERFGEVVRGFAERIERLGPLRRQKREAV